MKHKSKKGPAPKHPKKQAFQEDRGRPTLHGDGLMPPPLAAAPDHDDVDLLTVVKRTNALPLETLL